jgi:hypothetical protein
MRSSKRRSSKRLASKRRASKRRASKRLASKRIASKRRASKRRSSKRLASKRMTGGARVEDDEEDRLLKIYFASIFNLDYDGQNRPTTDGDLRLLIQRSSPEDKDFSSGMANRVAGDASLTGLYLKRGDMKEIADRIRFEKAGGMGRYRIYLNGRVLTRDELEYY